jgi:hypothetical protein
MAATVGVLIPEWTPQACSGISLDKISDAQGNEEGEHE